MARSEEHTSELQSLRHLVCRLLLEKKKNIKNTRILSPSYTPMSQLPASSAHARSQPRAPASTCPRDAILSPARSFLIFFFIDRAPPKISPFSSPAPFRI